MKLSGARPSARTGMNVATNTTGKMCKFIDVSTCKNKAFICIRRLGNRAYFFGGVHDDEEDEESIRGSFFNDLYCLDLDKLSFSRSV